MTGKSVKAWVPINPDTGGIWIPHVSQFQVWLTRKAIPNYFKDKVMRVSITEIKRKRK